LNKIKILEIIDGGFLGGGQTNVLSIIKNIDKNKFEVHVAAGGSGKFEDAVKNLATPFHPVELPKFLRTKFLQKVQSLHNKEKFDIIHSHGGVAGFYGRLMKKHNPELKSVHTIHGIHYINLESFFIRSFSKAIEQYLVQFTDKTICVSRSDFITAAEIKITNEFNTVVIPNGIDVSKFSVHEKSLKLLNELGLNETNFVIGNISRFDVQKNQKLIIQAAYYLVRKFPEMRFIFVGKGKFLKRMMEYTRESGLGKYVIFTGELYDLPEVYSIFNIFVLPSFWEGMPYVLLEAMASKIPVICSSLPGLNEVIMNNFSALTIDPFDMDDLFKKILILYSNEDLRNKLNVNAFEAVKKYDEKMLIKDYEKIYMEVMDT
jgi:glycosyltransferase involved in cell wall biosynthesis